MLRRLLILAALAAGPSSFLHAREMPRRAHVPSHAPAVGASTATFTLREVLDAARRDNPEIRAARRRWSAARARILREAAPENPRVDLERMYAPRGSDPVSGAEERNVAVSQEVPFPTTLFFRGRLAKQEAEMAEAAYRAKELEVLARVKSAYAMLYLSRHSLHIFEANTDLMRQFAKAAESKYAAGRASQSDALKAQVELSKMLNMLVTLGQEQETNQAMLNTLLNRPPDAPLGVPQDIVPARLDRDLAALQALALKSRPELAEAAAGLERSRTALKLGRSEYLPDLMLQYRRRDMRMGEDSHDAMLGLSVPLWFWKQGAMVREAAAERETARAEYQAMRNMTLFDVKNLLVKVQTAHRLLELYETTVLPQAEQALKVSDAAYRADRMGFLELLDSARTLLDFRLEYYQYAAGYEQSLAELERVVGTDLTAAKEEAR